MISLLVFCRNDDEVDEDEILVKLSKATASSFNFKVMSQK